ncbi:MAG: hypothetical protein MPN21_20115 [Thermoanaerobaculia bacterium]|nr:hypothetical protein [Thermoanaerobaculia bacterium]
MAPQLLRRTLLWFVPAIAVWWLITPYYNLFLIGGTETLVRATEDPSVTRLAPKTTHYAVITRTDRPTSEGAMGSFRVTDIHFPFLLLWALFLGVPGVALRTRLEAVGWASLLSIFFHLFDAFLWVKFTYATQLGAWSAENYSSFQQNFWGLSKHVADLPVKFGLPLALWVAFFYRRLTGDSASQADG